jgi:radical SAM protein with 4Fe4S-binding SPASM domain
VCPIHSEYGYTFYGGEPLLGIESILNLYVKFKSVKFIAEYDIITNGYLLNDENIEKLSKLPITTFQITIDDDEYIHNKCLNDVGIKEKCLFNINSSGEYNQKVEARYFMQAWPFLDEECKYCFLLFSCFGGCPFDRLNGNKTCLLTKYKFDEYIEMYYDKLNSEAAVC